MGDMEIPDELIDQLLGEDQGAGPVAGPVGGGLPRDRAASFEPRIVPKHARSFDGFDEQILALYAGGMTTREIQRHLRELYGIDVSDGLISEVTASIPG